MPCDVRWINCLNFLKWYLSNWYILKTISDRNASEISSNPDVLKSIKNMLLYKYVEHAAQYLEPVPEALNTVQRDDSNIYSAIRAWKKSFQSFRENAGIGKC